jgi:hypothetical protein
MSAAKASRGGTRPGAGRPSLGGRPVTYRLDDATRAILRAAGDGNETEGIRRLASRWRPR